MKERRWSKLSIIGAVLFILFIVCVFFSFTFELPLVLLVAIIFYWASFIIAIVSLFFIKKYNLRGDVLSVIIIVLEIVFFLFNFMFSSMESF